MMLKYYARICWNTKGWVAPSGDAKGLETGTYSAVDGFGHEEWLFNFMWLFDGYHYAFLQGVNTSQRALQGQTIEVILWGITPQRYHVYIGRLLRCEVLSDVESLKAYAAHERAGWLALMHRDLLSVDGNTTKLSPDSLFNIRFRPADAIQYDDPLPIAGSADRISKLKRYPLVPIADSDPAVRKLRTLRRQGSMTPPTPGAHFRTGSKGSTVDPYHPILQEALMLLLQRRFGQKNVMREEDWVDLTVRHKKRKLLIELKTDPLAKRAIREAIGQILEYAYFEPTQKHFALELFIVAPGALSSDAAAYLKLLNQQFGIPIRYCQFSPGGDLPNAFLQPFTHNRVSIAAGRLRETVEPSNK